jgi:hypothetical protein
LNQNIFFRHSSRNSNLSPSDRKFCALFNGSTCFVRAWWHRDVGTEHIEKWLHKAPKGSQKFTKWTPCERFVNGLWSTRSFFVKPLVHWTSQSTELGSQVLNLVHNCSVIHPNTSLSCFASCRFSSIEKTDLADWS